MSTVAVKPIVLKNVDFTVDVDNYSKHVSSVVFTLEQSDITWTNLDGETFTEPGPEVWKCTVGYAQDWETIDSLSSYLFENRGTVKTVRFQPKAGSGLTEFTAECTLTTGQLGGATGEFANSSATFGCNGAPVKGAAA